MLKERYIEFRANKFREEHGYASTEPLDPYKLLAKLNVITVFKEMTDNFSGMAVKNSYGKYMLVNSGDILARQHFTIGHELYLKVVFVKLDYLIRKIKKSIMQIGLHHTY
jgi:Zn-dependent peptidase ImmA (M78 family)